MRTPVLSIQNPVQLGEYDLPQPDVARLKPRPDYYGSSKGAPSEALLVVEVSDSTLRTDLGRKARIEKFGRQAAVRPGRRRPNFS
jgi:hypothetical protein